MRLTTIRGGPDRAVAARAGGGRSSSVSPRAGQRDRGRGDLDRRSRAPRARPSRCGRPRRTRGCRRAGRRSRPVPPSAGPGRRRPPRRAPRRRGGAAASAATMNSWEDRSPSARSSSGSAPAAWRCARSATSSWPASVAMLGREAMVGGGRRHGAEVRQGGETRRSRTRDGSGCPRPTTMGCMTERRESTASRDPTLGRRGRRPGRLGACSSDRAAQPPRGRRVRRIPAGVLAVRGRPGSWGGRRRALPGAAGMAAGGARMAADRRGRHGPAHRGQGREFKVAFTVVALVFLGVGMRGWRAVRSPRAGRARSARPRSRASLSLPAPDRRMHGSSGRAGPALRLARIGAPEVERRRAEGGHGADEHRGARGEDRLHVGARGQHVDGGGREEEVAEQVDAVPHAVRDAGGAAAR